MAETERDPDVTRRYAELAREEPPRALDETILAAAHRQIEARPAPLVAPTARRRWYVPLAAAAVIVLSVVVTLQMQREQLDADLTPPPAPAVEDQGKRAPRAPASAAEPKAEAADARPGERPLAVERQIAPARALQERRSAPQAVPAPLAVPETRLPAATAPTPGASAQDAIRAKPFPRAVESAAEAPASAGRADALPEGAGEVRRVQEREGVAASRAEADPKRAESLEPPERWLERIAALRRDGKHREADEAYAEFRRRYPDYRIPESLRGKVLPP